MENPTLPTNWLAALSNAPQCPGFQESEQETGLATSDFWNPTLTAHMMVLDFRNRNWKRTLRERIAGIGIGNGCGAVCNMAEQAFFT